MKSCGSAHAASTAACFASTVWVVLNSGYSSGFETGVFAQFTGCVPYIADERCVCMDYL
jgi:hypothetical protein